MRPLNVALATAASCATVSVRQLVMVASWTPQQQQYIQKDEVVEPPQIVIKLRKARIIPYIGLRKFWLIQIFFWRALSVVAVDYAAEQLVQPVRLLPQLEQHHHAFDALQLAYEVVKPCAYHFGKVL
jgi:hypothetical protein